MRVLSSDPAAKLTVSELTELIRRTLEGGFPKLLVEGEISNFRPSSTGPLYFTLKDSGASIAAVMFRNRIKSLSFEPKDGMLLRVRGSLSVYAPRGSYSLVVEEMEKSGEGELLAVLEERKRWLAAEGEFPPQDTTISIHANSSIWSLCFAQTPPKALLHRHPWRTASATTASKRARCFFMVVMVFLLEEGTLSHGDISGW